MEYRIEKDTMGQVQVPANVYWGAQTQRSIENFKIAQDINKMPREIIRAFAYLKKAAALTNLDAGVLPPESARVEHEGEIGVVLRDRLRRASAGDAARAVLGAYDQLVTPDLPAIPLFTLAGFLLAEGQAPQRLLRLFRAYFGWMPGGTAVVTAVLCAFFTLLTGGSGVTILALGGLLLPALLADGYRERFSLGMLTAARWRWDHKTIFSLLGWAVFAGLLAGRLLRGWRGRQATRWLYSGAALLLLAYVGSRFVLEVVLGRSVY